MAEYQFSEKEYMRAILRISRRRLLRSFLLFMLALSLIMLSFAFSHRSLTELLMYFAEFFVLICGVLAFTMWRQMTRAYRQNPVVQALLHLEINDQELRYTWERGSYVMPWSNLQKTVESPEFFFLFETPISVRIIPKRALSQEETDVIRRKIASLSKQS